MADSFPQSMFPFSPQFQSFHGLHSLQMTGNDMRKYLRAIYNWALNYGFASSEITKHLSSADKKEYEKHKSIRLLGTFFHDSFDRDLLKEMIKEAHEGRFDIKILMLDPYRDVAKKRGDALRISPINAVKKALRTILEALHEIESNTIPSILNDNDDQDKLRTLLTEVHKFGPKSNIEVKFYHSLTDSPIYLISQFVIKGLILEGVTSEKKPWMVFVDSISQKDDIYDQYSNNFNVIFHNYRFDRKGNLMKDENGRYRQDANHSRRWPIGLDIFDSEENLTSEAINSKNKSLKEELIKLVKEDDLITIIEKYLDYTERESLKSELFSLWGRLTNISSDKIHGIVGDDVALLERNKIRSHLVQLILQL